MSKDALPTYRLHKSSAQSIVTLNGQTLYLGKGGNREYLLLMAASSG